MDSLCGNVTLTNGGISKSQPLSRTDDYTQYTTWERHPLLREHRYHHISLSVVSQGIAFCTSGYSWCRTLWRFLYFAGTDKGHNEESSWLCWQVTLPLVSPSLLPKLRATLGLRANLENVLFGKLNGSSIKDALGLGILHGFLQLKVMQVIMADGSANVPVQSNASLAHVSKNSIRKNTL